MNPDGLPLTNTECEILSQHFVGQRDTRHCMEGIRKLEAITSRRYVIWVKNIAAEMISARRAQADGPPRDIFTTPEGLRRWLRHLRAQPDDAALYEAVRAAHSGNAIALFSWLKRHERSLQRLGPKAGSTKVVDLIVEFGAAAIRQACRAACPAQHRRGRKIDDIGDQLIAAVIWVHQDHLPPSDPSKLTEIVQQTGSLLGWKVTRDAIYRRIRKLQRSGIALQEASDGNMYILTAEVLFCD